MYCKDLVNETSKMSHLFCSFCVLYVSQSYALSSSLITKLNGYSPDTKDNSDLVYFDNIIAGASVVGLGESTRGTSEFFQMKHCLFKHLVESKGFTIFAMENSMAISSQLNEYVLTGIGDPKAILKTLGMNFPYASEEVLALVRWMHD